MSGTSGSSAGPGIAIDRIELSDKDIDFMVQRVFGESLQGGEIAASALKDAEKIVHLCQSSLTFLLLARCKLQIAIESLLSNSSIHGSLSSKKASLDRFFQTSLEALNAALQGTRVSPECAIFVLQLAWALDLQKNEELYNCSRPLWVQAADAQKFSEFHEAFDQQFLSKTPEDAAKWAASEAQLLYGQLREDGGLPEVFPPWDHVASIAGREKFIVRARETALLTNKLRAKFDQRQDSSFFPQLNFVNAQILEWKLEIVSPTPVPILLIEFLILMCSSSQQHFSRPVCSHL